MAAVLAILLVFVQNLILALSNQKITFKVK